MKLGMMIGAIAAAAIGSTPPQPAQKRPAPPPPRYWPPGGHTIFGRPRGGSERAGLRYSRNDMHAQQQRSHDPSWQAMNKHIKAHLYGETS